jgi:predicted dehydrogenase
VTRVGLIGSGYWARTVHGASARQHPAVELVGVWGRDRARTDAAAAELNTRAYPDLDRLIADVDALTFAVPPDVQAEIAIRAAHAGRHLLLEKPIATSVADAHNLETAVKDAAVASIVFLTRRFVPATQAWLQHLQELGGWECGRAEFAAAIFVEGNPFGASAWRREKGALWDIGPHALSLLLPVLGDVTAVVGAAGLRDQVHLVMRHAKGGSSTVSLSLSVPPAAVSNSVYVYGVKGRELAPADPFDPVVAHRAALDALIEQIAQSGSGHACDVHFGARIVEILSAAEQSLHSGRLVQI